jgi:aspartyl protease family protein
LSYYEFYSLLCNFDKGQRPISLLKSITMPPDPAPELAPVPTRLRWGPTGIVVVWLLIMGALYLAMEQYLKPKPVTITADGTLVIAQSRDGHFYAQGTVAGKSAQFLVDTGASLVTVSNEFANQAGLHGGVSTVFKTANGDLPGRILADVPVTVGPIHVSGVRVGVGLVGGETDMALLGQSFLKHFEVNLSGRQMTLKPRPRL